MKSSVSYSLWRWFCFKIFSLAIGSIILIALCMWLRYALLNWWVLRKMPLDIRQEFLYLRAHPNIDHLRFSQLVNLWFGETYADPSISSTDWGLLVILLIVVLPVMVILGLRAARPLSDQFSHLAKAAKAVTDGHFFVIAPQEKQAPQELIALTHDFNMMTRQLAHYDAELRASHVALAHELRSPLTAAIGRLQGMLDAVFPLNEQQLNMVMRQLQNLNHLVEDLHFLSLADANQLILHKEEVCLYLLLEEKIHWLQPQLYESNFMIENQLPTNFYINLDKLRFGQLFIIILENALRYASEGEKVTIKLLNTTEQLKIIFLDYGNGVKEDFLPQIFQKFTRADESRTRHTGGSGLGLSIAQAIAQAHNGLLQAINHPKGGLCITFTLPKVK